MPRPALGRWMPEPGLCANCGHAHAIEAENSTFYRCLLHESEPERFDRYPELPVRRCDGFEEGEPDRSDGAE